jgi:pimeloyl-ACP methyl ester carboxylesterase
MLKPLAIPMTSEIIDVLDVQIEVQRRGSGRPIILLPGEEGLEVESPFIERLAESREVVLLWPPGFGRSNRPEWVSFDDISYIYFDVLKRIGIERAPFIGCSLGGWIAAEMATKSDAVFEKLVLIDPYGIKIGGPMQRDIADIYALHPEKLTVLKWADPSRGERRLAERSDEELYIVARNIESTARLCWEPYMHNPKLLRRLHRISCPTLFVWGERDGIVSVDYGRAYSAVVPGSKFVSIPDAGHFPHIEQTQATFAAVIPFLA